MPYILLLTIVCIWEQALATRPPLAITTSASARTPLVLLVRGWTTRLSAPMPYGKSAPDQVTSPSAVTRFMTTALAATTQPLVVVPCPLASATTIPPWDL